MNPQVLFRVDGSERIGSGHVVRCLAIANELRERGMRSRFVCRAHAGHLGEKIAAAGHELVMLPLATAESDRDSSAVAYADWLGCDWETDAAQTEAAVGSQRMTWLIIDHYALDARWEARLRPRSERMLVIDDLADRAHDCDILLDPNLGRQANAYARLLPATTRLLIGPCFALLRPEFSALRERSLQRRLQPHMRQIMVSMGGADADNVTGRVLTALAGCALPEDCRIVAVVGAASPWRDELLVQAASLRFGCEIRVDVSDMARLMLESDLAIGAGGGTAWERCCLGLPSIVLVLAENQRAGAQALHAVGAAELIASMDDVGAKLPRLLQEFQAQERLAVASQSARAVTDGRGIARLLQAMEELACHQ